MSHESSGLGIITSLMGDKNSSSGADRGVGHNNSRALINLQMLTSEPDDLKGLSISALNKSRTSAQIGNSSIKSKGSKSVEKNAYDHMLMQQVKRSIKVRKRLTGNSLDEKGEHSNQSGFPKIDNSHGDGPPTPMDLMQKTALSKSRS